VADRPKRMLIQPAGGLPIELDEETTTMLYAEADAEGIDPYTMLRAHIHTAHLLMRHGLMKKAKRQQ
jgi:hypothetical protein